MIKRRDLFIGAACVVAAGAAYGLKPRNRLTLMPTGKMENLLPIKFSGWSAETADGLVQPKSEGELAAMLYSELVGRIYRNAATGDEVMMLVAYGDTQSDLLQLHRPESCYAAVGFEILESSPMKLHLSPSAVVPARRVVATAQGRQENIIYWTRMGEQLPTSGGEQRKVRFQSALEGNIPDGVLIRFSVVGTDSEAAFEVMEMFIPELIEAVAADKRRALIGTKIAGQINA